MVEGPVDMLLYPTMFRESAETDVLGFQFVPGLSTTAEILGPLIPGKASHVVYLTDADDGGMKVRQRLVDAGVQTNRIVTLRNQEGTAIELEDFVDPALLLRAANNLIERFHTGSESLQISQLKADRRMSSLEQAYAAGTGVKLPKIELAYEILSILDGNPAANILDKRRRKAFGKTVSKVISLFAATAD